MKPLLNGTFIVFLLVTAPAARAQKVAVIDIQGAIAATQDGRQAASGLESKYNPKRAQLQIRQDHVQALANQLRQGSMTLSDEGKARLSRDIQVQTKSLNRDAEDLNDEQEQEQRRTMQDLFARMIAEIEKYAAANGYTAVLDIGSPQTPVVWAAPAVNITDAIVKQYDTAHPAAKGR